MADYEKLRRKRDAQDMIRADAAREQRRIQEQRDRDKARKDHERRHWEAMAMEKAKAKQQAEQAHADIKSQQLLKELEEKKQREIDLQLEQMAQRHTNNQANPGNQNTGGTPPAINPYANG